MIFAGVSMFFGHVGRARRTDIFGALSTDRRYGVVRYRKIVKKKEKFSTAKALEVYGESAMLCFPRSGDG